MTVAVVRVNGLAFCFTYEARTTRSQETAPAN